MGVHQAVLMNGGSGETEAIGVQPKVMEVPQVLHMNGGCGETSYAKNSVVQNKIISIAKPIIEEAILDLYCNTLPKSLAIADLGCSSGPNTLLVISEIIDTVHERSLLLNRPSPEFRVFLNDLPANDFNSVFRSLPAFHDKLRQEKGPHFGPCFISGVPGSFYGRLFPDQSLQFVHSSSSLHWLSQASYIITLPLFAGPHITLLIGASFPPLDGMCTLSISAVPSVVHTMKMPCTKNRGNTLIKGVTRVLCVYTFWMLFFPAVHFSHTSVILQVSGAMLIFGPEQR